MIHNLQTGGRTTGARMSENLRLLGKYSAAMDAGDTEAVFEFWSTDFVSHVTDACRAGRESAATCAATNRSGGNRPAPRSPT